MSTTSWSVGSIAALLADVTWREPLVADDGKSGNALERVEIDGVRYVVKHQSVEADWIMRVTGDRVFWPHRLWRGGMLARVPARHRPRGRRDGRRR